MRRRSFARFIAFYLFISHLSLFLSPTIALIAKYLFRLNACNNIKINVPFNLTKQTQEIIMTFVIEKNVKLPSGRNNIEYSFLDLMDIGDSVYLDKFADQRGAYQYILLKAKSKGLKLVTRAEGSGRRIWRTA